MSRTVCVAGQGAWGKALAHVARAAGHQVSVWQRGDPPPPSDTEAIILAVPAQAVRDALRHMGERTCAIIIAAKGIERGTGLLMADVVRATAPGATPYALSGPSFARDVMQGLPTAVTLAGPVLADAAQWSKDLSLPTFRIYHTDDLAGVELGGALKNVLAVACGIADGKGLGESARAALITRGFAEMARLASKLGARRETLMGLSGLGDLILTCASGQSRNHSFGVALGKGGTPAQALALASGVVEGAATAAVAVALAQAHDVELPISAAVRDIIDRGADPDHVITSLLARPALAEFPET